VKYWASPGAIQTPAAQFGEHTRAVPAEAGFTAAEIDTLFAEGAAKEPQASMAAE
jgi:hypothetical protein